MFTLSRAFAEHRAGGHGNLGVGLLVMVVVKWVEVFVFAFAHGFDAASPSLDAVLFRYNFRYGLPFCQCLDSCFLSFFVANIGTDGIGGNIKA